jgi:hypothetical protein
MAPLHQHMEDCRRFLGSPHEDVNRWIDEFSATVGPTHRRLRHHWEGVRQAERLFGNEGARAAIVHILRDCRNVPSIEDYNSGLADALGLKSTWPVSAYIRYTEEAFSTLVKYTLEGPMAVVLWGFFRTEADLVNLLRGLSRLSDSQQKEYLQNWDKVNARCNEMSRDPLPSASFRDTDGPTREYFEETTKIVAGFATQFQAARFVMAPVEQLITPLTLIDYEYVEQLKATLVGTSPRDVAAFAFPQQYPVNAKIAMDPSGRAINFISAEKSVALTPFTLTEIPGVGFEVKATITGTPQLILVSHVAGRLYLLSGVHRAYLLASLGLKEIPCLLIESDQIPFVTGVYPTFAPHILALPRPPLLIDTFDTSLTLRVPSVRTTKIIRISAEDLILPVD